MSEPAGFHTGPAPAPGADVDPIHPVPGPSRSQYDRIGGNPQPGKASIVDVEGADSFETNTMVVPLLGDGGVALVELVANRDPWRRKLRIRVLTASANGIQISTRRDNLPPNPNNQGAGRYITLLAADGPLTLEHRAAVWVCAVPGGGGAATFDVLIERVAKP